MKNLILGTLATALVATSACGGSSSDVVVDATWTFHHADDPATASSLGCPVGYNTAAVYAQAIDANIAPVGPQIIDLYTCSDFAGSNTYPDDTYLMWIQIQTDAGGVYANSASELVDTAVNPSFTEDIIDDGGYFFFTWSLQRTATQAPLTCADAGLNSASGTVETVSTDVSDSTYFRNDKFTCADHYGVTAPLRAGTYTVAVDAADSSGALGASTTKTNVPIAAPNGLTNLGHIIVNVD